MSPYETRPDRAGPNVGGLVIAAGLFVLAAVIAIDAWNLPDVAGNVKIGPRLVPFIVAGGLALLSIPTAIEALRGTSPRPEEHQAREPLMWVIGGLVLQILIIAGPAALLPASLREAMPDYMSRSWGFVPACGVLFGMVARGFGRKPLILTTAVGLALSFVVWLAFAKLLQLSLPQGPLERYVLGLF